MLRSLALASFLPSLLFAQSPASQRIPTGSRPVPSDSGETHLTNVRQLTFGGENAEAGFSARGDYVTFKGRVDRRLTNYGTHTAEAAVSPDGGRVAFTPLKDGDLDVYATDVDGFNVRQLTHTLGGDQRQITHPGGANFGPSWTADGRRIILSSNHEQPRSGNSDLYLVNPDGTGLEPVTTGPTFDGFPMFSRDGRHLVWASSRRAAGAGETTLFVADWKE